MNTISIILPVHNEAENIERALNGIKKNVITNHEVLMIYDSDTDNTIPVAKKIIHKSSNILFIKNSYGHGIINAVKTGIKKSRGDNIVIMSPDLADDPRTIEKMFLILEKGYDIVSATRYAKGGKRLNQTSLKAFLSHLVGLSTPTFLGIPTTDLTNGFKMYRKEVLQRIPITSKGGWEFTMELVIKAHYAGYKISEVPTVSNKRKHGKSKFKFFSWLPKYLMWYIWGLKKRVL